MNKHIELARDLRKRISELEANLKRATAALKAQQLETVCECKNCMNATEAIMPPEFHRAWRESDGIAPDA
jgi:lipoate synthase